ncbi:hypothetical protein HYV84_02860 [Candidatus Woesearchaeota archaeon]|nr:hypothetical protein [Candidatus Woesearchaeota archaeon]
MGDYMNLAGNPLIQIAVARQVYEEKSRQRVNSELELPLGMREHSLREIAHGGPLYKKRIPSLSRGCHDLAEKFLHEYSHQTKFVHLTRKKKELIRKRIDFWAAAKNGSTEKPWGYVIIGVEDPYLGMLDTIPLCLYHRLLGLTGTDPDDLKIREAIVTNKRGNQILTALEKELVGEPESWQFIDLKDAGLAGRLDPNHPDPNLIRQIAHQARVALRDRFTFQIETEPDDLAKEWPIINLPCLPDAKTLYGKFRPYLSRPASTIRWLFNLLDESNVARCLSHLDISDTTTCYAGRRPGNLKYAKNSSQRVIPPEAVAHVLFFDPYNGRPREMERIRDTFIEEFGLTPGLSTSSNNKPKRKKES